MRVMHGRKHFQPSGTTLGFLASAWTGDSDSGIDSSKTYTAAVNIESSGDIPPSSESIQGVTFERSSSASGSGWSMTGSLSSTGDASNNLTGASASLAEYFKYNGNPRVLTFSGLTIGVTYIAAFYSVGWAAGVREQEFTSGSDSLTVDVDTDFGIDNGAKVEYTFVAGATTRVVTITPTIAANTFHMYGISCREA